MDPDDRVVQSVRSPVVVGLTGVSTETSELQAASSVSWTVLALFCGLLGCFPDSAFFAAAFFVVVVFSALLVFVKSARMARS